MSCDEFYAMFLLYNDGKLNAFGWAFNGDFNSSRLEHPSIAALSVSIFIVFVIYTFQLFPTEPLLK